MRLDNGLHVYSDGCYEPKDGTGGWAFVAYRDGVEIAAEFGHVADGSNNSLELTALLNAVRWINAHASGQCALLWSDSAYAVNGCNRWRQVWKSRGWRKKGPDPKARSRVVPDRALWIAIDEALDASDHLRVRWCKGHAGVAGNEMSDRLAERGRRMLTDRLSEQGSASVRHGPA